MTEQRIRLGRRKRDECRSFSFPPGGRKAGREGPRRAHTRHVALPASPVGCLAHAAAESRAPRLPRCDVYIGCMLQVARASSAGLLGAGLGVVRVLVAVCQGFDEESEGLDREAGEGCHES